MLAEKKARAQPSLIVRGDGDGGGGEDDDFDVLYYASCPLPLFASSARRAVTAAAVTLSRASDDDRNARVRDHEPVQVLLESHGRLGRAGENTGANDVPSSRRVPALKNLSALTTVTNLIRTLVLGISSSLRRIIPT